MPYFINVGQFKQLKGGMGARGWHIWRTKNIVHVCWGPIEVRNRYPKRFLWASLPTTQTWPKRSVEAAKEDVRKRINEKKGERRANGDKAYQQLTRGHKILGMPSRKT